MYRFCPRFKKKKKEKIRKIDTKSAKFLCISLSQKKVFFLPWTITFCLKVSICKKLKNPFFFVCLLSAPLPHMSKKRNKYIIFHILSALQCDKKFIHVFVRFYWLWSLFLKIPNLHLSIFTADISKINDIIRKSELLSQKFAFFFGGGGKLCATYPRYYLSYGYQ